MVALSGGVDSSVAAALLKKQGHEVIGATMQLRPLTGNENGEDTSVKYARKVADALRIPHHVFDLRDIFSGTIIDYFCQEYAHGRTPNPCVLCNRFIKFGVLWEKARDMGMDFLATGHYAGIEVKKGRYLLKKGVDHVKDQSYFLYRLTQQQLSHTIFPLAGLTKDEVREISRNLLLPVTNRPESQEICFIPDKDYADFVENYLSIVALPGPILDKNGNTIGQHHGITHYTIGQRKGLGITSPEPLYVTGINQKDNTITVGTKEQIFSHEMIVSEINWVAFDQPDHPIKVQARARYRAPDAEAIITPINEKEIYIKFSTPQLAVTPGQSVVFYDNDILIGGGVIVRQGR